MTVETAAASNIKSATLLPVRDIRSAIKLDKMRETVVEIIHIQVPWFTLKDRNGRRISTDAIIIVTVRIVKGIIQRVEPSMKFLSLSSIPRTTS